MSVASATNVSVLNHYAEWRLLTERPCNVLVEGSDTATDAFVGGLLPHIRGPIVQHRAPGTLNLPTGEVRALILRDATALSRDEQRRLLAWMSDTGSQTQIITTASCPAFALVEAGVFDAALYYRLNVLLVCVVSPLQSGLAGGNAVSGLKCADDGAAFVYGPFEIKRDRHSVLT
jgi:hypothetical protein